MRLLLGMGMWALLAALPGVARAESGLAAPDSPVARSQLDFQITIASVLATAEAVQACSGDAAAPSGCHEVALRSPGRRMEHRSLGCVPDPQRQTLTCTTASP